MVPKCFLTNYKPYHATPLCKPSNSFLCHSEKPYYLYHSSWGPLRSAPSFTLSKTSLLPSYTNQTGFFFFSQYTKYISSSGSFFVDVWTGFCLFVFSINLTLIHFNSFWSQLKMLPDGTVFINKPSKLLCSILPPTTYHLLAPCPLLSFS